MPPSQWHVDVCELMSESVGQTCRQQLITRHHEGNEIFHISVFSEKTEVYALNLCSVYPQFLKQSIIIHFYDENYFSSEASP